MKLEQFRYLLEINRLHSISAAARTLHIGQTTLSAIVKVVEEEVGFPIFQRTPNGVIATPLGEHFMALAWEINVKYEELLVLKQHSAGGSPAITLVMCPAIALRLSIPLLERFSPFDLRANLTFEEVPSEKVGKRILENAANIGITYLSEDEICSLEQSSDRVRLDIERLLPDEICLLTAKDHPMANREFVDAQEILGEWLATGKKLKNDKVLGDLRSHCKHVTSFSNLDVMCQAILEQGMVGFAPKFTAASDSVIDLSRFCMVPLRNTPRENKMFICLVLCHGRNLRYQERILVSCIREYFQGLRSAETKLKNLDAGGESS